jgi:RHS repeat-associated protein
MGALKLSYYEQERDLEINSIFLLGAVEKNALIEKKRVSSSRYGFNGMEKDDEVKGSTGSSYSTYFRQYDPRLGRWLSIDPKALPYESPYVSMANNPIKYMDPLGDKIVNAQKGRRDKAKTNMEKKKGTLDAFGGDTKAKGYGKANRQFKKAQKDYNSAEEDFQSVETAIKDLSEFNEGLFNDLDDLEDATGNKVNVYVGVKSGLNSGMFSSSTNNFVTPIKLLGLTQVKPDDEFQMINNQTGESSTEYTVKSYYGKNTITIMIDKGVKDKGSTLSHEGGHGLYNVKNLSAYIKWMRANPGKSSGGHGGGNPSEVEAHKHEGIYDTNQGKLILFSQIKKYKRLYFSCLSH